MALLDALIARIPEPRLREEIAAAVRRLTGGRSFGLVFEEHVPETTSLIGLPIQPGSLVEVRTEARPDLNYRVVSLTQNGKHAPTGWRCRPHRRMDRRRVHTSGHTKGMCFE
jgi:hypothetical protein